MKLFNTKTIDPTQHYSTSYLSLDATAELNEEKIVSFTFKKSHFPNIDFQTLKSLDLLFCVSNFRFLVYKKLFKIKAGQTQSYKDLALALNTRPRAIARAMATNKIALFMPCHRIVANDGSLSGYGWGIEIKKFLLENEGVKFKNNRVLKLAK